MKKISIIGGLLSVLFAVPILAQMSSDEAIERMREREAAASTQPNDDEAAELKSVVHHLSNQCEDLQAENARLRRLVPEAPQVGWNFSRVRHAAFARTLATGDVFNVSLDGRLEPGTPGQRVDVVSDNAGLPMTLANGQVMTTVTHQHARLAQVELYDVFVNNNTPYDPTADAETNIKRMTDAYLVLVNVDNGYIDFADRNDDVWSDVFAQHQREETTIIMQETTTVVIKETPD
jgi:hypothetical protein